MKRVIIPLAALPLVLTAAPVANAGGRLDGGKYDWEYGQTIHHLCAFPITVVGHLVGTFRYVAKPDGGILEVDNWAEQDTISGPGATLTSDWYHFRIAGRLDEDFNTVSQTASGQMMLDQASRRRCLPERGLGQVRPARGCLHHHDRPRPLGGRGRLLRGTGVARTRDIGSRMPVPMRGGHRSSRRMITATRSHASVASIWSRGVARIRAPILEP